MKPRSGSRRSPTRTRTISSWSAPCSEGGVMSAQDDAELVRRGYEAFIAGDMEWLNEHLHENVVWHVPGQNVTSGDYRGREDVLGYFAKAVQLALPEFEAHDIVASDAHVIALAPIRRRRMDHAEQFEDRTGQ